MSAVYAHQRTLIGIYYNEFCLSYLFRHFLGCYRRSQLGVLVLAFLLCDTFFLFIIFNIATIHLLPCIFINAILYMSSVKKSNITKMGEPL